MDDKAKIQRETRQLKRLETLLDSVFALVIVLIALNLPEPSQVNWSGGSLGKFLLAHVGDLGIVVIGLILVVVYWVQNNALFGNLVRTDNRHAFISIVQVFFLLFYLYTIGLGVEFHGEAAALALQSCAAALVGIAAAANWWYASKDRRLLSAEVSDQEARELQLRVLAEPITALITLPCSFLGPVTWELAWLTYPLVALVLRRWKLPKENTIR